MIVHQMIVFPAISTNQNDEGDWETEFSDEYRIYPFDMEETLDNILAVLSRYEKLDGMGIDVMDDGGYVVYDDDTGKPLFIVEMGL